MGPQGEEFWREFYAGQPRPFEWLAGFEELAWLFGWSLRDWEEKGRARVLDVGCGTSAVLLRLYEEGWGRLVGVDFNAKAVEWSRARASPLAQGPEYRVMDAGALDFPAESFTHVFDKGTLDCLLSGEDSAKKARRYLAGVDHVLAPGGAFLCVSTGPPARRLDWLQATGWVVRAAETGGHHAYLCRKGGNDSLQRERPA